MKNPSTSSSGESDERAAFLELARMYCAVTETPSGDLEWSFAMRDMENFATEVVTKHRAALATHPAESKACASVGVEPVVRTDHCQGPECRDGIRHASDCAMHCSDDPQPCDCGATS